MEHVKTNDVVMFSQNFYHPSSGDSIAADTTPVWYVYPNSSGISVLDGVMVARTDIVGSYYGMFHASGYLGFDVGSFYDVQVSGAVEGRNGFNSVKQFVLDDIYDVNLVQVSGDIISLNSLKADVSNLDTTVSSRMPTTHIDATTGTVDNVTLVATTTTNSDMRGTDNAMPSGEIVQSNMIQVSGVPVAHKAILDANVVQVSGIYVAPGGIVESNVVQVSGEVVSINDFKADVDGLNDPTAAAIADAVWNEAIADHDTPGGTGHALVTASGNLISGDWSTHGDPDLSALATNDNLMTVSGSLADSINTVNPDIYFANIKHIRDNVNAQDEYGVQWFKNDQPVSSGDLTDPRISVYGTATGDTVIDNTSMFYSSPVLGVVRYNEASSLIASGEPYLIETSGTIDSSMRAWRTIVGIDAL